MSANDLWFTARGAGLSAMLALTVAVCCGALGASRLRSVENRVLLQYLHRTAAVLGLLLIGVHVSSLVLDPKARVGLAGALLPFAAHYRPNAVALGSISMYLLIVVISVGLARVPMASSRTGTALWRSVHLLAYPAWCLAIVHGMLAGTDRAQRWVVLLTVSCAGIASMAAMSRVLGIAHPDSFHKSGSSGRTARARAPW